MNTTEKHALPERPFGLTAAEAEAARERYGSNRLTERRRESFWDKLRGNFGDPMIKILCAALLINVALVTLSYMGLIGERMAWYEPVGIAAAILIATLVSTFSEYRNENAFQTLQKEASRILCKVWRDGAVVEIPVDDVVTGDAVLLQSGDKVPADGVIIDGELGADQSALNGESKEAVKTAAPPGRPADAAAPDFLDRHSVFRGAVVCSGSAVMRVERVGDATVYGGIAREIQSTVERDSPLKVKLEGLARTISRFGYAGGALIAAALLFQHIVIANQFEAARIAAYCADRPVLLLNDALHAVMLAVIIIVMAVPEGLPLMIAIVSALNMGKMLKDNVLVRTIAGIETAGSLNYLFSDKTGTITRGKLEVVTVIDGALGEYGAFEGAPPGLRPLLALSMARNTGAVSSGGGGGRRIIGGNATERALLGFVPEAEAAPPCAARAALPFNSANKYSAMTVAGAEAAGGGTLTLVKGAPERILDKCAWYYDGRGQRRPFTERARLEDAIGKLAERAIRVVALAVSDAPLGAEGGLPAGEWALVCAAGIRDEARPESVTALREAREAGVHVAMITGDRRETAFAVARDAGLVQSPEELVLGSDDLARMTDGEVKEKLPLIRVVARALPADKSRLVRLAQEAGYVAGMTGDGVNDSPALKKADVGFAMGGGTEVAKEAGDIVILDDNFSSIAKAILYGRTIFNSIRKFIVFQLTINVSAVLITFFMPLLGHENPLSITQILWINLVMDTLAALAFGGEPALRRFMREKPVRRGEPIVSPAMRGAILWGAAATFAASLVFLLSPRIAAAFPGDTRLTGYFAFFVFAAILNAFNARTNRINLFDKLSRNRNFILIMGMIAAVQITLVYLGGPVFGCYGLSPAQWGVALKYACAVLLAGLAWKFFASGTMGRRIRLKGNI